ncbi:diguanylate cyclase [Methylolobus aquaticus]
MEFLILMGKSTEPASDPQLWRCADRDPDPRRAVETRHLDEAGDAIELEDWLLTVAEGDGGVESRPFRFTRRDGTERDIVVSAAAAQNNLLISLLDLTEQTALQRTLLTSNARYQAAFQGSIDAIVITRLSTGEYLDVNRGFIDITGFSRDEALGRNGIQLNLWVDLAARQHVIDQVVHHGRLHDFEAQFRRKNGELFWGLMAAVQIEFEDERCLLAVTRDISQRKRFEHELQQARDAAEAANRALQSANAELARLASTDTLTRVWNRWHFDRAVRDELARVARYGNPVSLLLLDIDRFKAINDRYGHLAGDEVLIEVCRRLQSQLRRVDVLARWGGEEFAIMLPHCVAAQAGRLAERLRAEISASPFPAVGSVTCSFGVAQLRAAESFDAWLARADEALYRAKAAGRNRVSVAGTASDAGARPPPH